MEENEEKAPEGQPFLPPEVIKANIGIELTKQFGNHQEALNYLRNTYVGKDNVQEVQNLMRNLNSMLSFIEGNRKRDKEPYLEEGRKVDKVYKDYVMPFEEVKTMVQQKLNIVARELEAEEKKKRDELQRRQQITDSINQFTIDYSVKIASATNNEQLLGYERLINLEKANKSKYEDQLPLLIERCNDLNEKVKEQKELIREKEKLEAEKKKAQASGDDEKMNELLQKEGAIDEKIAENTILVQEEAASSLILNQPEEETEGVRARRTTWKAELINVKDAMKKAPDMLDVSLNPTKVREAINTLKAAGTFKGKTEVIINGIRYYEDKTF